MKPCHVAFLPSPGMGHILPLFQLAKKLALHHHVHVSFLLISTEASAAQAQFFRSPDAVVPNLDVVELPPADVSDVITAEMRVLTQLAIITRESLRPLKTILTDLEPTSVVIDNFTTDAIDVCRELSIPVYSFFTASTVLLTLSLYLPTMDREIEGEFVDLPAPVEIPGCPSMRTEDLLDQVKDRKNDEYKWYLLHVSRLPLTSGILLNVWDDLDPLRLTALNQTPLYKKLPTPPVYPIGPLVRENETLSQKDIEILAWLDSQPLRSVLYVSFGSGGSLSSQQLTELAHGLETSRQRFVLVARKPTDASASAAYFTVGKDENDPSGYLPEGFVDRTRGVGLVVPEWAPQMAVLAHPAAGAFLSHCGWNSTLEGLWHGVLMIAWPLYAEQGMNARMLAEEVGVAVRVERGEGLVVGREEVERVVREVMEGERGMTMRRRDKELKESGEKACEEGGSSYRSLCRFLDGLRM